LAPTLAFLRYLLKRAVACASASRPYWLAKRVEYHRHLALPVHEML